MNESVVLKNNSRRALLCVIENDATMEMSVVNGPKMAVQSAVCCAQAIPDVTKTTNFLVLLIPLEVFAPVTEAMQYGTFPVGWRESNQCITVLVSRRCHN